jgi:hypothetical protein
MNIGTRSSSRLAGAALAPFLALALAGCSGNSPAQATAASSATGAASGAAPGSGNTGRTVEHPAHAGNVRRDVSAVSCAQAGSHGWRLSGTAANPSSSSRAYSIVVDFVTVKGDTVLDSRVLNVGPVAPESGVDWSVTGAARQRNVACVIRRVLAS